MKKTPLLKDSGIRFPIFWNVVNENDRFLHVRNWLTGENRVIRK